MGRLDLEINMENRRIVQQQKRLVTSKSAPEGPEPPQQPIFISDAATNNVVSQVSQSGNWDEKLAAAAKEGNVRKSAPAPPQQPIFFSDAATNNVVSQVSQSGNWDEKLAAAAKEGNVKKFINKSRKVSTQQGLQLSNILEQTDSNGNTHLHVASWFGRYQLVDLLMSNVYGSLEKSLVKTNNNGDTAFHMAAKGGHLAVMGLLLRCGEKLSVDPKQLKNDMGNTLLHDALLYDHHHLVNLLLYSSPFSSCYLNNQGKSPFYLSVEAGNEKTFNAMLKAARETSTLSDGLFDESLLKGRSLPHVAILYQNQVMLQAILAQGMHMLVHVIDENGESTSTLAERIGFYEGTDILYIEFIKGTTDAGNGAQAGAVGANPWILANNPDLEGVMQSPDWDGRHAKMRKLLENVMLPQQQDTCHHLMDLELYEASIKGEVDEFIIALEQYSVERQLDLPTIFTQLTPLKNTFLHVASRYGHKDLSWLIVWYFPSLLNKLNSHGNTALHLAAKEGNLDIVRILVKFRNGKLRNEHAVNINSEINDATCTQMIVENDDGRTPLQLAYKHGQSDVVKLLIKENVEEAYHVNKRGSSLLYAVILNGETNLMKDIFNTVSSYVNQNVLNDQLMKGKSLLLAAIWSHKSDMLQELARRKPVLFEVKNEHAQKLVQFAELLGFQQGANYLHGEFKLEIVLGSTGAVVVPHSYSLDAHSLSVIGMEFQGIENIRRLMYWNKRHERMKILLWNDLLQENQSKKSMDSKLYEAAKKGDVDSFINTLENFSKETKSSLQTISEQRTHIGNTFLHVAASNGNKDLTSFIVFYFRNLLRVTNIRNNTANHEAAKAGHLGVLDILVSFNHYDKQLCSSKEYDTVLPLNTHIMCTTNVEGKTSLHEAFVNNHRHVIEYLVVSSVEEAYHVNTEGKSGLYLAVEAGMLDVVKTVLSNINSDDNGKFMSEFINGRSLIHAAIRIRSRVMLQEILRKVPAQINVIDKEGQTPLFYAVSTGFVEGVTFLLDELKTDTTQMDPTGFYPVHVASKSGCVVILQKLIQICPDAGGFRNREGQNILHVAAMYGKNSIVGVILQTPDLGFLINEIDNDGNTPLHLAAINWHPKVVSFLTWDRRVNLNLVNKDGLTALDAAEECMEAHTPFIQRLTWSALKSAGVPRGGNKDRISSAKQKLSGKDEGYNMDYSKDRVNTLLLVATLIVTITFASGLTMPGGYDDKQGQANLLQKHMLQTFIICDTIALYSSIMVAVTLIWAQLGDLTLVVNALSLALPLLGLSLTTMSIAFVAGVSLAVSNLAWLASFVLIFGIISLASIMALFSPLCLSYLSTHPVLRNMTYYPFLILVMASGGSEDSHIKEK